MEFTEVKITEIKKTLTILNLIALDLKSKNISQWTQWIKPKSSDIQWIEEKINNCCFFFIKENDSIIGMFSLSDSDEKYWGKQDEKSKYLHSLSILPEYKGKQLGEKVILKIKSELINSDYKYLRLDCISTNQVLKNYYQERQK
jgi:ribosomal protein S18 acetylase RimI-like enzyme